MTRRPNRAGTVYETADGRFVAEVTWVDRFGRKQRATAKRRTREEAEKARRALSTQAAAGDAAPDQRATVESYWKHWRETTLPSTRRKASTVELYRTVMRVHVIPALGGVRLARLTAGDIEGALAHMTTKRQSRGRPPGEPVSGQTRRTAHAVLALMLETAVRDGLIPRNVARDIDRPDTGTAEAEHLTAKQLREILDALNGHRLRPLVLLLATTGLRLGEALALRWPDIDIDAGTLRVTGTVRTVGGTAQRTAPKSLRSRRTLPLDPQAAAALRAWRKQQAAERLRAGTTWHDDGAPWVFTTEGGRLLDQRNAARAYERALKAGNVQGVPARFHILRHSVATMMLTDARVSLRVAADILGHSSTRLTADTYGHVADTHRQAALHVVSTQLG